MRDERFENEKLRFRQRTKQLVKQHGIDALELVRVDAVPVADLVPDVVDADQDADNVRLQIDEVLLDARVEIDDTVAADPAVEEPICAGMVMGLFDGAADLR